MATDYLGHPQLGSCEVKIKMLFLLRHCNLFSNMDLPLSK